MARLELVKGDVGCSKWPFTDKITLGRDETNDLKLPDTAVSRNHAVVERRGGLMILYDLDSRNGTFLNGVPVRKSVLRDGDQVGIGGTVLRFVSDSREQSAQSNATFFSEGDAEPHIEPRNKLDVTMGPREACEAPQTSNLEQLRSMLERERTVSQVNDALGTLVDLNELFERMLDLIFQVLPADRGVVLLRDAQSGGFSVKAVKARDPHAQVSPKASRTLINKVCKERIAILSSDARADERFEGGASILKQGIRSVMCVPLVRDDTTLGVIHVDSAGQTDVFSEDDLRMLTRIAHVAAMAVQNALRHRQNQMLFHQTVRALAGAVDLRDPYTAGHSERVASFSRATAAEMGLSEKECNWVYLAGALHDIGKIGIRDEILRKPGKLDRAEYEEFKVHPSEGVRIITTIEQMQAVTAGLAQHHERFDGTGYPAGLSKDDISKAGRIIAVADTFDAVTSDRPYRKRLADEAAFGELKQCSGRQFDPEVVAAFLRAYEKGNINSEE